MTTVGHALLGASIGLTVLPRMPWLPLQLALGVFVLLANLPDLPLTGWGHDRYELSHSLPVTAIGATLLALVLRQLPLGSWRSAPVLAGLVLAWFSHLLLDTLYGHGLGLAMFWPFSEASLALPLPWFDTLQPPGPDTRDHNLGVFRVEALWWTPVLLLSMLWRRRVLRSAV